MLLPGWYFHKENYHCFPDISSIAPSPTIEILYLPAIQTGLVILCAPPSPTYLLSLLLPPPPFTIAYVVIQHSDQALLKCLQFTKVLCLISASVLQEQGGAIACSKLLEHVTSSCYSPSIWLCSLENSRSSYNIQGKHCIIWKTVAYTVLQSYLLSLFL